MLATGLVCAQAPSVLAAGRVRNTNFSGYEEAPPQTAVLWLTLLALVVIVAAVSIAIKLRRRRTTIKPAPRDPIAEEAARAAATLFCRFEPAWTAGDTVVEGPIRFRYLSALESDGEQALPQRVLVHVQGRLRPGTRQVALSSRQRTLLLSLAAAILFASFVGLALAPATRVRSTPSTTIVVQDGTPLGGAHQLTYRKGSLIDIGVVSDVAGQIHLHGYDIHRDVAPGHPARFLIRATIEGSYAVELESTRQTLAQVTVQP